MNSDSDSRKKNRIRNTSSHLSINLVLTLVIVRFQNKRFRLFIMTLRQQCVLTLDLQSADLQFAVGLKKLKDRKLTSTLSNIES